MSDKPAVSIKEMLKQDLILSSGHRMCAGCGAPTVIKLMSMALRGPTIVCNSTGCLEVATTIYPYTAWKIPWIHVAFENSAAVASGALEAINAMREKGHYKHEHVDVIAIGGDGGTFDIGFGAISGALERGHDLVYMCYDNGAYQNTGIQRSGATFTGQETTTSWAGDVIPGKRERKKPLAEIVAAHKIPYEVIDGEEWIMSGPSKRVAEAGLKPVDEYFKTQGQFKHLFKPEWEGFRKKIQEQVNHDWEVLKKRCGVD
jgi:pyruvate/2-oxoacid:ferredoxin oxidoreductase beta subunit